MGEGQSIRGCPTLKTRLVMGIQADIINLLRENGLDIKWTNTPWAFGMYCLDIATEDASVQLEAYRLIHSVFGKDDLFIGMSSTLIGTGRHYTQWYDDFTWYDANNKEVPPLFAGNTVSLETIWITLKLEPGQAPVTYPVSRVS